MLQLLMCKFKTEEFRFETGTETCLHPPECVDEVFELPLSHGVEVITQF
jgi:hypothetical protein